MRAMLIMQLSEKAIALGEMPDPTTLMRDPFACAICTSRCTSSSSSGSYTRLQSAVDESAPQCLCGDDGAERSFVWRLEQYGRHLGVVVIAAR